MDEYQDTIVKLHTTRNGQLADIGGGLGVLEERMTKLIEVLQALNRNVEYIASQFHFNK